MTDKVVDFANYVARMKGGGAEPPSGHSDIERTIADHFLRLAEELAQVISNPIENDRYERLARAIENRPMVMLMNKYTAFAETYLDLCDAKNNPKADAVSLWYQLKEKEKIREAQWKRDYANSIPMWIHESVLDKLTILEKGAQNVSKKDFFLAVYEISLVVRAVNNDLVSSNKVHSF